MEPRARIYKNKIEIDGLLSFVVVLPKNSQRIVKITQTAIFIRSPLAPDIIIPIPISR